MKIAFLIALLLEALILSGCAAVGYGIGGAGAARSEVMFLELEKRVQAIEDRVCRE